MWFQGMFFRDLRLDFTVISLIKFMFTVLAWRKMIFFGVHKVKCKIIICLPRLSLTHHQTSHGEQFHSHTTFSTVSPDLFTFITCTPGEPAGVHVWNAQGASGRPANSSILWQKPSGSPWCWAMSTGPIRLYQTLRPLSRSLLLNIWSETFIVVVCEVIL